MRRLCGRRPPRGLRSVVGTRGTGASIGRMRVGLACDGIGRRPTSLVSERFGDRGGRRCRSPTGGVARSGPFRHCVAATADAARPGSRTPIGCGLVRTSRRRGASSSAMAACAWSPTSPGTSAATSRYGTTARRIQSSLGDSLNIATSRGITSQSSQRVRSGITWSAKSRWSSTSRIDSSSFSRGRTSVCSPWNRSAMMRRMRCLYSTLRIAEEQLVDQVESVGTLELEVAGDQRVEALALAALLGVEHFVEDAGARATGPSARSTATAAAMARLHRRRSRSSSALRACPRLRACRRC